MLLLGKPNLLVKNIKPKIVLGLFHLVVLTMKPILGWKWINGDLTNRSSIYSNEQQEVCLFCIWAFPRVGMHLEWLTNSRRFSSILCVVYFNQDHNLAAALIN